MKTEKPVTLIPALIAGLDMQRMNPISIRTASKLKGFKFMLVKMVGLAAALTISASAWAALPTVAEVQEQVRQGHYQQAETMMQEVVAAKQDSPKAHYLYAELLAHNARFDLAAQEAQRARALDPQIKFTQAEKFNTFVQLLERERATAHANASSTRPVGMGNNTAPAMMAPTESSSGMPGWVWGLGLIGIVMLIWRMVSNRQQQMAATPGMAGGGAGYGPTGGYAPGMTPMGVPPSGGGGLLGTGVAVAGGLAAGMLLEKVLDERHGGSNYNSGMGNGLSSNYDSTSIGNPAADALEQRPVDFGSGDSWDSGGGIDVGGSDSW